MTDRPFRLSDNRLTEARRVRRQEKVNAFLSGMHTYALAESLQVDGVTHADLRHAAPGTPIVFMRNGRKVAAIKVGGDSWDTNHGLINAAQIDPLTVTQYGYANPRLDG